ncbi:MAG: hypothetical protein MUP49_04660 [Dehalococcoidia bacterium]|nr:hypothetical protein [Dehalococcoidia bacterium]
METRKGQVKAAKAYYEVAQKEYDDSQRYYDAIDSKVNIFLAISIAVPSLLLSIVKYQVGFNASFVILCLGFLTLFGALFFIFQALRIRKASAGVVTNDFKEACKKYEDEAVRESIANLWLESAENNFCRAKEKAKNLIYAQWLFPIEMLLFILATVSSSR